LTQQLYDSFTGTTTRVQSQALLQVGQHMLRYLPSRILLILLFSMLIAISLILIARQALSEGNENRQHGGSITFGIADPNLVTETAAVQASQLAAMKSIGITSVRVDANWSQIQPESPTVFDWAKLDQEVDSIRAAGMSADLIVDGCPQWASYNSATKKPFPQPASSVQYAAWAADVATRYAPKGVKDFEIWNEPNIVRFWQPKPNPAAYTADLVAAYAAIKAADPSAFIISGGLAPADTNGTNYSPISFLRAMYSNGAKGNFDALGYHPYSFPVPPDKYESWSAWSQMASTNSSIKSIMAKNGDSNKPIWITEFGAPSTGPSGIGATAQRIELSQAFAAVKKTNWIGALYIYTWRDTSTGPSGDNGFGLLTAGNSPKPAYYTVASAIGNSNS
jgi:polysaccharide biosynthesis protein PslG